MFKRISITITSLILAVGLITPTLSLASDKGGGMPPAVVNIGKAKLEDWQSNITAVGTLSANQGVVIKPEIAGRVTGVYFRSGDYVKTGAPLLQLNPDILRADYLQKAAQEKLSAANYQRTLALYNKKVFAKADLDNALATYESDKASAESAKAALAQTFIQAPFNGRLGLRLVNLGDYVKDGQAIVNLEDINLLRVDFSVPEINANQIKLNQTVALTSRAYPDLTFTGRVYATDSTIDANSRTLGVRAAVPNKDHKLIPGAFVDVKLMTGVPQKFITIPQTALSYEGDKVYVYKVVDGKAAKTIVTTGMRRNDDIAILTGLKDGDNIITAGQMKVTDGQPVMPGH